MHTRALEACDIIHREKTRKELHFQKRVLFPLLCSLLLCSKSGKVATEEVNATHYFFLRLLRFLSYFYSSCISDLHSFSCRNT